MQELLFPEAAQELADIGRFASERGWVPATAGNFSRRLDERHAVVTRSGVDKGALRPQDLVVVAIDEPAPKGVSAETPLHLARYRASSDIGAIVHVHTIAGTVLSRKHSAEGELRLYGYEMHKALDFTTHESTLVIPVFENMQDTMELAERVEERLADNPDVPGYLLAGHGVYAWGATMAAAKRHLEALEFLLSCELEERRLGK
ncbi:MAG: methylthioribulose 1-phosphate dehydratase [Candidatus Eremiobacteraeota bacterium]|nr:methylthioribulose 1-phosphate dehydratase [Candidatus Eremiobacteraeota bacterium]